jgi:two-component system, OmpR family, response regulator RegX3
MRFLVVDDDDHVVSALELALKQHGHEVTTAATGVQALEAVAGVDFVLLDLGLPDLDGTEVCRRIRESSTVPIMAVTARSDELDRVLGLQVGADDYLVKPFGIRELLARIMAVSRRVEGGSLAPPASGRAAGANVLRVGPLEIDLSAREATLDGKPLTLTRKEFDLLVMLAEEPGTVHTREAIIDRVWDENWFGSTRTLDVHIGTLRSKLGGYDWVTTVRRVGFRLSPPDVRLTCAASSS